MVESEQGYFGKERSLVPTGKIEKHVLKEVLAKSVGDTASFLQFLEMQKYLFWRKCVIICMVEFIVVTVRSFERSCLASGIVHAVIIILF